MKNSRYEIKFILNSAQVSEAFEWIYFHTSDKPVYQPRIVNSIYFDDVHFNSVKDNLIGISRRSKYRLRWYGGLNEQGIESINFEIKNRVNRTGNKIRKKVFSGFKLNDMKFGDLMTFLKNEPGENLCIDKALYPTLQVAYKRKYFEGGQGIRVTLDSDIYYYKTPLHSKISSSQPISYPMTIMEVKFHPDLVKVVSSSFKEFHLIPKRHSKYLTGISMLGNATYI
jgi:SPX domain protein involved in polyphosphate accumulation